MPISRSSRFFKFLLVAFLAITIFIAATRHRISQTVIYEELEVKRESFNKEEVKGTENEANVIVADVSQKENVVLEQQRITEANQVEEGIVDSNQAAEEGIEETVNDDLPGAHLKDATPAPENQTYCKFNYGVPYDLIYSGKHYLTPPELGKQSPYRILYNVTEAHDIEDVPQITFATHMTANFAYFIPELLSRWNGLITVAAFVPDLDSAFFIEQITQFCYCEPQMHRVSVHIVTHKSLAFSKKDINFFRPSTCLVQDSSNVPIYIDFDDTATYPVNVVRNVARTSALTKYVLVSDVELMPSRGLAGGFLQMLKSLNNTSPKQVFTLPVFEVEKGQAVPETKKDLLELLQENKAVYFHGLVCEHCQRFPDMNRWTSATDEEGEVKPFATIKRKNEFHRWEPVFIGTNDEPLYSELLSWEGLQDKMTQVFEMCLQDYDFTVLDNAFLCHWPGIKKERLSTEEWRGRYVEENRYIYSSIVEELLKKYKDIPGCNVTYSNLDLPSYNASLSAS